MYIRFLTHLMNRGPLCRPDGGKTGNGSTNPISPKIGNVSTGKAPAVWQGDQAREKNRKDRID